MRLPLPMSPAHEGESTQLIPVGAFGDDLPEVSEIVHHLVVGDVDRATTVGAYQDNTVYSNFVDPKDPSSLERADAYMQQSTLVDPQTRSTYVVLARNEVIGLAEQFPRIVTYVSRPPVLALHGLQRLFISQWGLEAAMHIEFAADTLRSLAHLGIQNARSFPDDPEDVRFLPHAIEPPEDALTRRSYEKAGFLNFTVGEAVLRSGGRELRIPGSKDFYHYGELAA